VMSFVNSLRCWHSSSSETPSCLDGVFAISSFVKIHCGSVCAVSATAPGAGGIGVSDMLQTYSFVTSARRCSAMRVCGARTCTMRARRPYVEGAERIGVWLGTSGQRPSGALTPPPSSRHHQSCAALRLQGS
jgi:hypothetical protein